MLIKQRKLLIIEDERGDYTEILKVFKDKSWGIIPHDLDEFFRWKNILRSLNESEIINHYNSIICENYNEISLIILDISLLRKYDEFGAQLLKMIRLPDSAESSKLNNWSKKVPIIALTKYDDDKKISSVLGGKYTVDYYFKKDTTFQNPLKLILTSEVAYSNFCLRMNEGNTEDNIQNLRASIDQITVEINSQFQKLQSYLDPKLADISNIKEVVSVILCGQLRGMSHDKAENFMNEFSVELSSIEPKYQSSIQEYFKDPNFKAQFVDSLRKGDVTAFADLLDKLYERLEETKIISSIPILKFVLPGVLALVKIISQHKD